ncbi:hypothetical protein C4544_03785 [candidate division WS5 bacterium]|uniref:Uncharacterized protein n=1 Tax=candidate division WS5 bacterium TaxID=2093353 RepID=A0A419DD82_9BACT|nr:MAG: hypothetical protein C4544_03785 [candidate division WS5 bacterium]
MNNRTYQETVKFIYSANLSMILIFIGIALRLIRYIQNPSLWFDTAGYAIDIIPRSFSDLINPSPLGGGTFPYGFTLLSKISTVIFGNSEYALRLFPLICSIVALFLFYKIACYFLNSLAVNFAVGLFAISDSLIIRSTEFKPYICDAMFAVLIYYVIIYIQSKTLTVSRIIILGLVGAFVLWFSHPAVFVLAGVGISSIISCYAKKEWSNLRKLSLVFSLWGLSFIVLYFSYIRPLMSLDNMGNSYIFWAKKDGFMPLIPKSLSDIQWYIDVIPRIFRDPAGMTLPGIASFAFIIGCISLRSRDRNKFIFLLMPTIVTLFGSSLHKYPFAEITIVFLIPFFFIFVAEGINYIWEKTSYPHPIIGIFLVGLLFIHPLMWTAYHSIKPSSREEIKPVLNYIKKNWHEGDIIYIYYMSEYAFEYYSKYHPGNLHFHESQYILGRAPRDWYATYRKDRFTGFWNNDKPFSQPYTTIFQEYVQDLNKQKGKKRVWFLFSSIVVKNGINEESFFIYYLESIGTQLDFFGKSGVASVYLYDLSDYGDKRNLVR